MLRFLDICFSLLGLIFGFPVFVVLLLIGFFDTGSPLFRQRRVGRHSKPFTLIKFRTMTVGTISTASHLVDSSSVTRFGRFLRRTKLDELPQLWNVLKGDMSLVGPRPCLPDQEELVCERQCRGVFNARPGITGLAQIHHVDMSTPRLLAKMDAKMLDNLNVQAYFRYVLLTVIGKGTGDRVKDAE
ncbi:sugar transferase [Marinobacter sp. F3R08]|uniref:sugar transferase n=1 Tax=Marinobacter sp. F3R08 TaxID=2841559 RepID=UPI001C08657E|nr:sugar transferase [Marinobacter sp. F3R08]MBU2954454.1 sugar transferase [Marinobacter sp. F3R08]